MSASEGSPDAVSLVGHRNGFQTGLHVQVIRDFGMERCFKDCSGQGFDGSLKVSCVLNCSVNSCVKVRGEFVQALLHGGDLSLDSVLLCWTMVGLDQPVFSVDVLGSPGSLPKCMSSVLSCFISFRCGFRWDRCVDDTRGSSQCNGSIVVGLRRVINDTVKDSVPSSISGVICKKPSFEFPEESLDVQRAGVSPS